MWGSMLVIAYCFSCVCVRAYVQVTMMRLLSLALWWLTAELLVESFASEYCGCVWDSYLTHAFCVCLLVWNHTYLYTYILYVSVHKCNIERLHHDHCHLYCCPQATRPDMIRILSAALHVVLRRDMSLNRRLYAWLLGAQYTHRHSSDTIMYQGFQS